MRQVIHPAKTLQGQIQLPGDKSISHRALMLASLCNGKVKIENLAPGQDVQSTLQCLQSLGINFQKEKSGVMVLGKGLHGLTAPKSELDAGNSGTTMRLLSGILAGQTFSSTLTGDSSLKKRDMSRIIKPLGAMGAKITSSNGFAPLTIAGGNLHGISYPMPIASSQVKSSILLAGLSASGTTEISEPLPTRDHTERMLRYLGIKMKGTSLSGGQPLQARPISVPGDFSSAAFFIAAALLVPEANLILTDAGLNPTRTRFLDILVKMGGNISRLNNHETCGEPRGDIQVISSSLRSIEIRGKDIPLILDEIPILAVLATKASGITVIKDAQELRKKESDRIKATVHNLRKMGAQVEEFEDGMKIQGPTDLKGAKLDGFQDHRIVMAFSIAGLVADGETVIEGAEWADISFPDFFNALSSLTKR